MEMLLLRTCEVRIRMYPYPYVYILQGHMQKSPGSWAGRIQAQAHVDTKNSGSRTWSGGHEPTSPGGCATRLPAPPGLQAHFKHKRRWLAGTHSLARFVRCHPHVHADMDASECPLFGLISRPSGAQSRPRRGSWGIRFSSVFLAPTPPPETPCPPKWHSPRGLVG